MSLPPFPVDGQTLDLLSAALDPRGAGDENATRSCVGEFLAMMSQLGGSATEAVSEERDGTRMMRDPQYHEHNVLAALVDEVASAPRPVRQLQREGVVSAVRPLGIAGAWEVTPVQHNEPGRLSVDLCRFDDLHTTIGHPMQPTQIYLAASARGAVRGIHYAAAPPGQTKLVTCTSGAVLDVVVDLRRASKTFGQWEAVRLDDVDRRATYIAGGVGHGYCVLSEQATLVYLLAPAHDPQTERQIHPFDPDLAIAWPTAQPLLSTRDSTAPTLDEALTLGLLPDLSAAAR
jgi:dTDP-4-dehydrorhamnose 3,5-epimerase